VEVGFQHEKKIDGLLLREKDKEEANMFQNHLARNVHFKCPCNWLKRGVAMAHNNRMVSSRPTL